MLKPEDLLARRPQAFTLSALTIYRGRDVVNLVHTPLMFLVVLQEQLEDSISNLANSRLPEHPEDGEQVKLPGAKNARKEVPRPASNWLTIVFDQPLHASLSLRLRQVECFGLLWSVRE